MNLGILAGAALVNGLNPCGIGLMITFLGYLLVFGNNKNSKNQKLKKSKFGIDFNSSVLQEGLIYILSVFVTYLILGLFFYSLAFYLQRLWLATIFKYILGVVMVVVGLVQLKDVFWNNLPLHLQMSGEAYKKLNMLMAKGGSWVGVLVGVLTTIFATPCMLPVYVGTTSYIAQSGLPIISVFSYFLYYNLIFISPLIVILLVMVGGKQVVEMKEWEHKYSKWFRLVLGIMLIVMGVFIIR
jgi:cytochrome c biogenesis protein CcdA